MWTISGFKFFESCRESTGRERTRDILFILTAFSPIIKEFTSVRDVIIYTHTSQNADERDDDDDDDEHVCSARCVVVFILLLIIIFEY